MTTHAKIIGVYEIIGGALGAIMMAFNWIAQFKESPSEFLLGDSPNVFLFTVNSLLGFIFFLICAYAGFRLYERKISGYHLSIWIQALQIPKIMIGGFAYFFSAGLYLLFGINEVGNFGFFLSTSITGFQFGFVSGESIYSFSINVLALFLCIYLVRLSRLRDIEVRLSNLKTCPFCSANLAFDKETVLKKEGIFCTSCKNVIRFTDLK